MESPIEEAVDLGRAWDSTRDLLRRAPGLFLGLPAAFVLVPQALVGLVLTFDDGLGTLLNVVLAVLGIVAQLAMTWAALQMLSGKTVRVGEALSSVRTCFWSGVGVALLTSIGIGVGLLLLVIPGLVLMTNWAVAIPAAVARNDGAGTALTASAELTKGSRWPIFGVLALIWGSYWLMIGAAAGLSTILPASTMAMDVAILPLVISAVDLVSTVGMAALYHELRYRGRGTIDQTAEVFA